MKQYEFMKDTDENGNVSVNVSYKPKRKLDLFPRIFCLFVALIVWLWMVNINDTDITQTMVIKIEYVGLDLLEEQGKMIYGADKDEITITVKGSNRELRKHDETEYKAIVDVSTIKEEEVGLQTLPLTVKVPNDSNVTVETEILNVSLLTDYSATSTIQFDVLVTNIQDSGLIRYSYESSQSTKDIEISGPKSVIDTISSGRFVVEGNFGISSDEMSFSDFPLKFLDKNLNEVMTDMVSYTTEDVTVDVKAVAGKTIHLNVIVTGEGKELVPKPSTDTIEIWGTPSVVRTITSFPIMIDKAEIGKTAQVKITNNDFPEGVNVKEDITVIISFEEPLNLYE